MSTGGGEIIFSLGQNEQSGTVNILATLKWLQGHRLVSAGAQLGQVDFAFEICSTGGKREKFAVSRYTLKNACGLDDAPVFDRGHLGAGPAQEAQVTRIVYRHK